MIQLGITHSEAADPLHSIGLVYHLLGSYDKALENINAALKIVEREFGKNHYVRPKKKIVFGFFTFFGSFL